MLICLIFSYILMSQQFKLKHADKGSYVCVGSSGSKKPLAKCPDKDSATDFKIETKPGGAALFFPSDQTIVWDIAEASRVEVKVKHGKSNQLFQLVYISPDKYAIVNRGKCIALEESNHFWRSCNYSGNQLYTIVYNESEAGELTESKPSSSSSSGSGSPPDSPVLDKLQKMIDDNKEIAKHIAYTHNHHHHHDNARHHAHSGKHEKKFKHKRRYEQGPYLLDYIND